MIIIAVTVVEQRADAEQVPTRNLPRTSIEKKKKKWFLQTYFVLSNRQCHLTENTYRCPTELKQRSELAAMQKCRRL